MKKTNTNNQPKLVFEFVQYDEFTEPYYEVWQGDNECYGALKFENNQWMLYRIYLGNRLTSQDLIQIATKLNELNESVRKQRILGLF